MREWYKEKKEKNICPECGAIMKCIKVISITSSVHLGFYVFQQCPECKIVDIYDSLDIYRP